MRSRAIRSTIAPVASGALLAVALAACGGGESAERSSAGSAPAPTHTAPAHAALAAPAERCGSPAAPAKVVRFRAADGVRLEGASVGAGAAGVVFVHEYPGPPAGPYCGFWPFSVYLAHHGVRSLLFNLRCFGRSQCPGGRHHARPVSDTAGAVRELRRLGARRVVLIGASLGGNIVVQAAAQIRPPPDGVVDLSGEADLDHLLGKGTDLNAARDASRVVSPALVAVARGDRYTPVADLRRIYDDLGSTDKTLIVKPASAGHGWDMLEAANFGPSNLARRTLRFVKQVAG
jgi:pimeloyl-ACP methyl ester carboxylesterase